jgi:hypothetical protein
VILGLLVWFGVTHTESVRNRGFLGMGEEIKPFAPFSESIYCALVPLDLPANSCLTDSLTKANAGMRGWKIMRPSTNRLI